MRAEAAEAIVEDATGASWLLCRVGAVIAALPVEHVIETLRPMPLVPVAGAPPYIRGLSVIRGVPVAVVDAGHLVGGTPNEATRFVVVRIGDRMVALAVDAVIGVTPLDDDLCGELPPLLQDAASETIGAIGARDADLLIFLHAGRLVPDDVLARLNSAGAAP